ncbi:FAD-dependent oxidoreductase [uncultured Cloacibacillus sp.]|uniref:FAD-dependent oxidoreductase n=1 Tax=uncultured Cloacibacillus sp. TaxID=889794 RepID=UPI0026DA9DD2|nr:FAD-dependent oxidoreductase [uncultured Cloacibacillus sp.]
MRIEKHPILNFAERKSFTFKYNGVDIIAKEGDTVVSALCASGKYKLRNSAVKKRPRGLFCAIGDCSSCVMEVNGVSNVRTCITLAEPGMVVNSVEGNVKLRDISMHAYVPTPKCLETDIAVIGGGPAGLKAALAAAECGANVIIVDQNHTLGGQLIKQTHKFFGSVEYYAGIRGIDIARELIEKVDKNQNISVLLNSTVTGFLDDNLLQVNIEHGSRLYNIHCKKTIVACGANEVMLGVPKNDLPGVYGAGAIQTITNVHGVKIGKKVLVVGAGNVGLILAYQLLQADIEVAAVVEAASQIGGFAVHANKIRRRGVPILLSHSVVKIEGKNHVSAATIARLDEKFNPIPGTEQILDVDTIALAVGLQPNYRPCSQAKCDVEYAAELCGFVPMRNKYMETSNKNILTAGDCSGIGEATTAMIEGELAGLRAAQVLGLANESVVERQKELIAVGGEFRGAGKKGSIMLKGLESVYIHE